MRVEFPVILINSTDPLQETINKRAGIWARRGSKMELPIICTYDFDTNSLVGKIFRTKRHQVKVDGIKYGSETLLQLKITMNHRRTMSTPTSEPQVIKIHWKSLSTPAVLLGSLA